MARKSTKNTAENTVVSSSASDIVIDGLAELTKQDKIERMRKLQAEKKARDRVETERKARFDRLVALRDGVVDAKLNPKGRHNPQVRPDTLRQASDGELVNGRAAKGWVVQIECATCGEMRTVNTQDAFQVRFCEEHKADAAKAAAKDRRAAKRDAELAKLDESELDAQLAALEAELAA